MASIKELADGKTMVQFYDHNRKRKSIRLGKVNKKQADRFAERVECLVSARRIRSVLDSDTIKWLSEITDVIHTKLAGFDLCEPRQSAIVIAPSAKPLTIGEFFADLLKMHSGNRPHTQRNLRESSEKAKRYFGADRSLESVTPLDADAYRMHLRKTLGENTTRRLVSRARQFFSAAVRGRHIATNPFAHIKGLQVRSVKERQFFITREVIGKLMGAAPDAEWQAILALARFGGLRVPSELFLLKWSDIKWKDEVFVVTSPKTAGDGKGHRTVPLFPELRVWLEKAKTEAKPGSKYIVTKHRIKSENLRQDLMRNIKKAGVSAWPKLFVNLRASRATELVEHFPSHVAAEWLGHTEAIANAHYRQTTDQHLAKAASQPTGALPPALPSATESGCTDLQNDMILIGPENAEQRQFALAPAFSEVKSEYGNEGLTPRQRVVRQSRRCAESGAHLRRSDCGRGPDGYCGCGRGSVDTCRQ